MTESPSRAVAAASSDPTLAARHAQSRTPTDALRADFRHDLDMPYGDHPRQVMDIYYPSATAGVTAAPILIWLHGGGFRRGSHSFDGYNGRPYLERGSIFVSMGYRLVPDVRFPDTAEDVELGIRWLLDNIVEHGGDPSRLYLSGHSAGAMLAAAVGFRSDLIQGLVLISTFDDVSQHPDDMINRASPRYAPKQSEAIDRAPAHTILIAGDQDAPASLSSTHTLLDALQARGASAELFIEPNADHFAANRRFHTSGSEVATAVARMMLLP